MGVVIQTKPDQWRLEASMIADLSSGDALRQHRAHAALVRQHERLAFAIASRYFWACAGATSVADSALALEDLHQAGRIGLWKSAQKFEPARGIKFATYASRWIRHYIIRFIRSSCRIYLPGKAHVLIRRFRLQQNADHMTDDERAILASGLAVSEATFLSFLSPVSPGSGRLMALEQIIWSPEGESEAVIGSVDVWAYQEKRDTQVVLHRLIHELRRTSVLTDREREVIFRRFGLLYEGEQTLEEIGRVLGVTREGVRKIERRAIEKLSTLEVWKGHADFFLETYADVLNAHQSTVLTQEAASRHRLRARLIRWVPEENDEVLIEKVAVPIATRVYQSFLLSADEYRVLSLLNGWDTSTMCLKDLADLLNVSVQDLEILQRRLIRRLRNVGIHILEVGDKSAAFS